ncbi:unnamed protein product [Rangifer tarandus platyrhynchus]|uniref:Uncharacterized protein n=1 Tax=Rangifer tarandus platyrhynchus TaxID=3082113 RepID=A0AC59YV20_RANTA
MCQSQKDKFCMIPLYEVVSKVVKPGDSLPVQWLGLHTLIAEGLGSIPGGELKSHQVHELHTVVKRFLIIKCFLFFLKKDLNPLKQKVEWWLPRTEGSWKMGISVDKFIQCAK